MITITTPAAYLAVTDAGNLESYPVDMASVRALRAAAQLVLDATDRLLPGPQPGTCHDGLAFAREVAPGLAWMANEVGVSAVTDDSVAHEHTGWVTVTPREVSVVVNRYRLRVLPPYVLTVASARHELHGLAQRLARSKLDHRARAGRAILAAMDSPNE